MRRLGLALFLVSAAQFALQRDVSIVNAAPATIRRECPETLLAALGMSWVLPVDKWISG